MKVYIASDKKIGKYNLPLNLEDYYSVEYQPDDLNEKFTITFSSSQEVKKWCLKSNGIVNVIDANGIVDEIALEDYHHYYIKILGIETPLLVYAMPNQENELYSLAYSDLTTIQIGKDEKCNICYKNPMISELEAIIELKDNIWTIRQAENAKTGFFINGKKCTYRKLKFGDIVFIHGLKLIWMPNCVKINNPAKQIFVSGMQAYVEKDAPNNHDLAPVSDEEQAIDLYDEDDYFYHFPRIKEKIEPEQVVIDAPPGSQIQEDIPFLLSIGTSLTMIASSGVTAYSIYTSYQQGKTLAELLPRLIVMFAMLFGSIIMPRVLKAYQKGKSRKKEKLRQKKYKEYLAEKQQTIEKIMKHEVDVYNQNNDSTITCIKNITNNNMRAVWNREIVDDDFLNISLGTGNHPTSLQVSAPEEHFTLEKDNLFESVYEVSNNAKVLKNVPITFSFLENNISSFIFNCPTKEDYINSLMVKFISFHSGADLKIVILTSKNNENFWDYTKILPHCWSDDKSLRFFATNMDELNEVSSYLDAEFKKRRDFRTSEENKEEEINNSDVYKNFSPYYLIITDDYFNVKNSQIILDILKYSENYGFSLITLANSMKNLPNRCENFIEIGEKNSCILNKNVSAKSQKTFINETVPNIDMEELSVKIANIPLMPKDGLKVLPTSLSFLDMFNVSKIEQLNILNRWQMSNPVTSLSTTVGVHSNLEPFKLDLHEKFHGPHGLIAGSTGSGKSEWIITYILSMALNYHPYEVQFVLIDYKGGGLAGAFENKETGVRIPHLIGTITNLDTSEMNRTLVSIESELKRRQRVFNEVRDLLGESTIDIYKYQRLYREGRVKEPMAHLFIISDEFAELKAQQPTFMDQLISTARIGRSLGVHLILATQKPTGVVNDQIWSNSKFKVCLKVQDRSDSMEMLKKPDAASLKDAGRFYLQVGYDDYFDIGQSGWGGAKYVPSNKIIKKVDDSINFVNNVGYVIKTTNEVVKKETTEDLGDQLNNIVKYIYELGKKENIKTKNLWLDKIPDIITINDIKQKYNYKPVPYNITPVIGEYDNPSGQEQGLLTLDLTKGGNTLIYGQSGSGKENLLSTIVWSAMAEHTPDEVNIYAIDCGAEVLKMFYKIPHVGEVITVDETDKIIELITMISEELERRKDLFADYAGSYTNYIENSGQKLPLIIIIINNYEMFTETYGKIAEGIQPMYRDCHKYGIDFIITTTSIASIRARMSQNFGNKISMQLPNEGDYRTVLNAPKGLLPAKIFGRGLVAKGDRVHEFQTANICDLKEMNKVIKQAAETLNAHYKTRAKKIVTIPDEVPFTLFKDEIKNLNKLPIGYNLENKEIAYYNFLGDKITPIISNDMGEKMTFIYAIIKELLMLKSNVTIVDFVGGIEEPINGVTYYNDNFDMAFRNISMQLAKEKESPVNNFYLILGIGEFKARLSEEGILIANNIFMNISSLENSNFIFIDNYQSYKKLVTETWYQTKINNANGIWIGEGVSTQSSINVSNITAEDRKLDFPYMTFVIQNSKRSIVKCIVDAVLEEEIIDDNMEEIIDEK